MGVNHHIYLISNMDIVLTKNGAMGKQVVGKFKFKLYEGNIGVGYNTKS